MNIFQESINGQKKQLATLRDRVNILERENANWKVEVAKTKSFLVNSEKQIARFRKLVEDRDVVITKQNKELREVNPEKNPVAGQLNQQLADCRRLVKDKDVLISKLNEQLEDINELHVRFEHLETVSASSLHVQCCPVTFIYYVQNPFLPPPLKKKLQKLQKF